MLRESSKTNAEDINLQAVMTGANAGEINEGAALIAFAEAVVGANADMIATARETLVDRLGIEAMIDAAGVASNFQRMVRIADATGITLGRFESTTQEMRTTLGIDQFARAAG